MKFTSWHLSSLTIIVLILGVFLFGASFVSGLLFLALFPCFAWWGWTLHERHIEIESKREKAVLQKYRAEKTRA